MRFFLLAWVFCVASLAATAQAQHEVTIGVLDLFHPRELVLRPAGPQALSVQYGSQIDLLNGEPSHRSLVIRAVGNNVEVSGLLIPRLQGCARGGAAGLFELAIPGKIHRQYVGRLIVTAEGGKLVPVVAMKIEEAVLSVVASEMPRSAPIEALKAQAVVARSFLSAGGRHRNFDFCDTTHCQFLRSPEDADQRIREAVEGTRGLVLTWNQRRIAAMYASRCGGQTRTLREIGMEPGDGYPYYSVACPWCRKHPIHWRKKVAGEDPHILPENESARIRYARQWGWSSLPGSQFTLARENDGAWAEGQSIGHGIGLCQQGAIGMASAGMDFQSILMHYYPNSALERLL
jgi:stage II sporulation protein D